MRRKHRRFNFGDFQSPIKTLILNILTGKFFAICSSVPITAIEVLKEICMDGNNVKKDNEKVQLSCGIYSSPAATRLSLQKLGRRSLFQPG